MNYWITMHWPRFVGETEPRNGVWVQDGKKKVISPLIAGHLIFIYESRSGPTTIDDDGSPLQRQTGAGGIVALVKATDGVSEGDLKPTKYANGKRLWWRWYVPTKSTPEKGFLPRAGVARILGYSRNYTFRGFGEDHSGLMQIDKEAFDKILASFRQYKAEKISR